MFGIPLTRRTRDGMPRILNGSDEASKARVSTGCLWRPGTGNGVTATAARVSGAGEPAFGVSHAAPDNAPMGKHNAIGPAREDNCAE